MSKDVSKLAAKWEKILESEGLGLIVENDRSYRQIPLYGAPANADVKHSRENYHGGISDNVEFYTMLKHYCEQRKYKFKECGDMSKQQIQYLRTLMDAYCDGIVVSKTYEVLAGSMPKNADKASRLKSKIYYLKKFQIIKTSFLADFNMFVKYMMYLKYSWTSNPKSWEEFKELETLLPGYHSPE